MSELGQKVIAAVRRHAAENPGFIYRRIDEVVGSACFYVRDGKPDCLIGQALWELGLIDSSFEGTGQNRMGIVAISHDWPFDGGELRWLSRVQSAQDCGEAWGDAVRETDSGNSWRLEV